MADNNNKGIIQIARGYFWRILHGERKSIETLEAAQSEIAKCHACGCDQCLGYMTQIDVETGVLMAYYIQDGEWVIEELEAAKVNLKALKAARDAAA